jgi:hypothetical protein
MLSITRFLITGFLITRERDSFPVSVLKTPGFFNWLLVLDFIVREPNFLLVSILTEGLNIRLFVSVLVTFCKLFWATAVMPAKQRRNMNSRFFKKKYYEAKIS